MRVIIDRNDALIAKNVEEEKARFDSYVRTATPELADRLGKAATAYNWVNPGILASHVLTGNDAVLSQVASVVGEKAFKSGITPTDARPGRVSVQERMAATQRAIAKANAAIADRPAPAPTSRTTPPKKESGGPGWWGHLPGYSIAATIGDWVTPEAAENIIGSAVKGAYSVGKAFTSGYLSGQMFISQALQNEVFAAANYLPSGHSFQTQKNKNLFDQFINGPLVQETYLGQLLQQTAKGAVSEEKVTFKDIMGTGFFPGGAVVSEQAKAAGQYRPLIGEQKLPMTFGRTGAQVLADVGVIEEGSVAYNIFSGTIDAGVAIKTDPTFGKPLKQPFGSAGKAASAIPERDAIRAAAGLVEGERPTVVPSLWNQWKTTPKAVEVLKPFIEEKDAAQIWRMLGRQGLLSADEMAQAGNHSELIGALDNAVNNLEPGYNIRNVPSGKFESVSDAGYKIKQSSQRYTNLFEVLPETTYIPVSEPQVAATRLDDLMGHLGFPVDQRNTWINKFIETHKEGTSESFFNFLSDFNAELLKPALIKNLVPESEAKALAKWIQEETDSVSRFTLQDLQDGVNPAWMESGGYGPVRTTQLLQDGAYIVDPTLVDEIGKKLGKVYKIEQQAQNLPKAFRGVITGPLATQRIVGSYYESFLNYWKPTVVAKITYLVRVLPEEQARVLLNGTFEHPGHYMAAIFDGRFAAKLNKNGSYIADVFGDPINKAKLAVELEHKIAQFRMIEDEVKSLRLAGEIDKADEIAKLYADEIASIPDLVVQQERTEKILNDSIGSLNDALIGAVPGKAKETIFRNYNDGKLLKSKTVDIVSKNQIKEQPNWIKGVVQEAADLYNNPHIRRIAKADLFDKDILTIDGVKATWAEHLAAGRMLDSNEAIARWLFDGSGRQYFEKYFKNFANLKEGYDWDTIEGAREFVRVLNNEVSSIAGTNETMLKAIATGSFGGEKAFTRDVHNIVEGNEKFINYISEEFIKDASSPSHIRYRPVYKLGQSGSKNKLTEKIDDVFDFFFKSAYGLPSDKLSRSPAFRAAYWGRIEEVAPLASKDAAEELLKNLDSANLPRPQTDRIKRLLKLSNGENDLEAIDASARRFGLDYERNLLFDSSKRSTFGSHHKYLFPFFEAYREQGSVWMKLLLERPENGHKIDVAMRALRDADGIGLGDANGDGKKDGFLFRDPQTGEERFAVLGSSWLGTTFSGVPFGGFSLPTGSLTMVSQVLPGVGPVIQYPAQYFIPKGKNWQWINDLVFAYGRPEETGAQPGGGFYEGRVPIPTWLRRVTPYISDKFKDLPIVGGTFGEFMGNALNLLADNPKETEVWRSYNLRVMQSLSSTRPIPKTQREMEDLLADAEEKTNKLYFLRGLGNFILPGVPVSKFMAKTKSGPVELGILSDELRRYQDEAEAAGETRNDGAARFIDVYGETVWSVFGSLRKSDKYEGVIMSKDFEDWFDKNQKLIKTYPQVASYFGPQKETEKFGPIEQGVYNRFITKGVIKTQTPEQLITQAQTNIAFTLLEAYRNKMTTAEQKSIEGQAQLAAFSDSLKSAFPKWDKTLSGSVSESKRKDQIRQLREIITEPSIKNTKMGEAVSKYLTYRDEEIQSLAQQGIKGWQKGSKSTEMRAGLMQVGDGISLAIPQFKPLWDKVLSKEFELPTEAGQP